MNLQELNPNQRKAVTTKEKTVLVMAGAGSGKTKVLTERIEYLLHQGVEESHIFAFTFTNKAAHQMKQRLSKALQREHNCSIQTFHSFCYSYITSPYFYPKLGYTKPPTILLEETKNKIIEDILFNFNETYSNIPFVKAISKIKNQVKLKDILPKDQVLLNQVFQEYQRRLKASSMIDFDDMLILFIELLKEGTIYETITPKYILVDECQDTNALQYEIIQRLSKPYGNIFMVGDEDQLIYSFRNSSIEILKDFETRADDIIILNQNYRSTKSILETANHLIAYNPNRLKKELTTSKESTTKVSFKEYATQTEEARSIIQTIKDLNLNPSDVAILYRNNNQAYPIEYELSSQKIPYTKTGGKSLLEYKEIETILYTYRLLFNPRNEIAFLKIYNHPKPCEYYLYQNFITNYHNQKEDLIVFAKTSPISHFQRLGQSLEELQALFPRLPTKTFYYKLLELLGYKKYLKESNQQKPQYKRIMAFLELIQDIPQAKLQKELDNLLLENNPTHTNGISLLTIHKSKGLEFQTVFIIGCNEGIIPTYAQKGEELEEERRCFYVAITRAKENLFLSCSQAHFINGNYKRLKPSSFLLEANLNPITNFFGNYFYNK